MPFEQLLEHVVPERRDDVRRLYGGFVGGSRTLADEHIDSFAKVACEHGLISPEGLREFLTYRALLLTPLADDDSALQGPRYSHMTLIARGGMGEVFLGSEPTLKRTVAIKRLQDERRQDRTLLRRFVTEAQVTAQLEHPAIVPVYGFERDPGGALTYAMKFVRGVTLLAFMDEARRQITAQGRPEGSHSLKARVETLVPVLNALAYAHRRGVVHRDLKPENIMVGRFGEVLVMDWGIARLVGSPASAREPDLSPAADSSGARPVVPDPEPVPADDPASPVPDTIVPPEPDPAAPVSAPSPSRSRGEGDTILELIDTGLGDGDSTAITRPGAIIGTPGFMSPEQARGEEVDAAADQYALGLILQELVTLRDAIPGGSTEGVLSKARRGERATIVDAHEPIPRELRSIIDKACAYRKRDRYASVEDMAEDVRRFLRDESVMADPDTGVRKVTRWIGAHRGSAMAAGIGLVLLSFIIAAFFVWRGHVADAAARAREMAIMNLGALVDAHCERMTGQLHAYEKELTRIATAATVFLTEPAPPSGAVVYRYLAGRRDPPEVPDYAVSSKVYGPDKSVRHADFAAAPDVDRGALRGHIDQLARLEPVLRSALLASAGDKARGLSAVAAERLVLHQGVPLTWTYFASAKGVSIGMPGTWDYEDSPGLGGYDHRREPWYIDTLASREVLWSSGVDENGLGLLLTCTQTVRDPKGEALGVAAIDLTMGHLIDDYLEMPDLAPFGAEALLLDREGRVLVRSSQKEVVRTLTEYAPPLYDEPVVVSGMRSAEVGHVVLPDGRIALWNALGRVGLTYLVVGPEAELLALGARGSD